MTKECFLFLRKHALDIVGEQKRTVTPSKKLLDPLYWQSLTSDFPFRATVDRQVDTFSRFPKRNPLDALPRGFFREGQVISLH